MVSHLSLTHRGLARDLYTFRQPGRADSVRQRWVRDVHRFSKTTDLTTSTTDREDS